MENQTQFVNQNYPPPANKKFWQSKKILFAVAGIIILGEIVWSVYILTKPVSKSTQNISGKQTQDQNTPASTLSFSGPASVKVNDVFNVDVNLNVVGSSADGVDLVIKYDPKALEVSNPKIPMAVGKIFSSYPVNSVDEALGVITVSGTYSPGSSGFSGNGIMGSISFKAKQAGKSILSFDFTKGSTKDSNIIETRSGHNILERVNNMEILIN